MNKKAFTLIELLVVVLIIGILAAVAVPQYQVAVAKSRTAAMLSLAGDIVQAQEAYYLAHGRFATNTNELDIDLPSECIVHSDASDYFACGKYWLVGIGGRGEQHVGINYCPDNNSEWDTCENTREFKMEYYFHTYANSLKRCYVLHNSKLGKGVCSNLREFQCRGC